jgi:uncharacterized protein DUF4388
MSLVGSLEDLGLGDILQIIHLSRKSGALWIRSSSGEGQIVFSAGLICGAFTKDGPAELRDLLLAAGALPAADVDASGEEARARGVPLGSVLAERGVISAETLDELRRNHVEASVLRMFTWLTGEFSFEIQESSDDTGEDLFVPGGMNPQFLALEGTRLHDEARSGKSQSDDAGSDAMSDDSFRLGHETEDEEYAGASSAGDPILAAETLDDDGEPFARGELLEAASPFEEDEGVESEAEGDSEAAKEEVPAQAVSREERAAAAPKALPVPRAPVAPAAVVAIDHDLASLEWLKAALAQVHPRVHIFQRSDQGISRIRQYLARAETPLVVLSAEAPADPVSGARDAVEIIRRLKIQAPRMPVFLVMRAGDPPPADSGASGSLEKPTPTQLADPRRAGDREQLAVTLRDSLREQLSRAGELQGVRQGGGMSPDTLARLRRASALLRDPASRGDVLSLVLRFAAESFSRVAMFMLRDDQAIGLAQLGLPKAGGPGDGAIGEVVLPHREAAWFRRVIDGRNPVRAAPEDEGDQRLSVLLGNTLPREAYVAPIESGERVVALLYADNLPGDGPLGDTGALEVVLHEAGLVLDRAVLQRALAEVEQGA